MGRMIMPLTACKPCDPYDVVVVGTGVAGLYTAMCLPQSLRVLVLAKTKKEDNNTHLAQGGIAASLNPQDNQGHIDDTLKAGCHFNNTSAVKALVEEAKEHVDELVKMGVTFDRDQDGHLLVTKEGGHNQRRVLHAKDQTGKEMLRGMLSHLKTFKNITLKEDVFVVDLVEQGGILQGITCIEEDTALFIPASAVVLATGGLGHMFTNTTNAKSITGDGIAMAFRVGAHLQDLEMIQFHPTAFYDPTSDQRFLISEAVRGEGGILRNHLGQAFMEGLHPLKDLAPRDIVARAIIDQLGLYNHPCVYLDVTHLNPHFIKTRFPMIYATCQDHGLDITRDLIPVKPVQHYLMGGVKVNLEGETSVQGLYAVGEVACNRVHGANRLASNSLLEGLVFSARAAKHISRYLSKQGTVLKDSPTLPLLAPHQAKQVIETCQNILSTYCFIYRSPQGIRLARQAVNDLEKTFGNHQADSLEGFKGLNALDTTLAIVSHLEARKTSLGAHQLLTED